MDRYLGQIRNLGAKLGRASFFGCEIRIFLLFFLVRCGYICVILLVLNLGFVSINGPDHAYASKLGQTYRDAKIWSGPSSYSHSYGSPLPCDVYSRQLPGSGLNLPLQKLNLRSTSRIDLELSLKRLFKNCIKFEIEAPYGIKIFVFICRHYSLIALRGKYASLNRNLIIGTCFKRLEL